ncbi:MAG TPA: hypothetical protein DDW42_00475 [Desulfobacteraceae bacterium]|nr:hypothetical protein [Desulfobacteraceae bacterium]
MEAFLDILWFKILDIINYIESFLDFLFAPLNFFGPAIAISTIVLITVVITKILTKIFKTKRYKECKKDFVHWYNVRQEASRCEDREKGKQLAKNIDQAKLNQIYYNFFFEGFMLGIATKYLPILVFLAYVNEAYKPENLLRLFGREYLFRFGITNGEPVAVGASCWFIVSLLLIYLGWFVAKKVFSRYIAERRKSIKDSVLPA